MRARRLLTTMGAVILALGFSLPAKAGDYSLEGFFGYYDPNAVDDHAEVYGARFGNRTGDNFGWLVSAGVIDLEDDLLDIENDDLRYNLILADFSFQWYPGGHNFYLFAGPGFARVDLEADVPGDDNDFEQSDDVFTINGGVGYRWNLGEKWFIRPEAKARWFDGSEFKGSDIDAYKGLDREYSLAIGYHWGG